MLNKETFYPSYHFLDERSGTGTATFQKNSASIHPRSSYPLHATSFIKRIYVLYFFSKHRLPIDGLIYVLNEQTFLLVELKYKYFRIFPSNGSINYATASLFVLLDRKYTLCQDTLKYFTDVRNIQ